LLLRHLSLNALQLQRFNGRFGGLWRFEIDEPVALAFVRVLIQNRLGRYYRSVLAAEFFEVFIGGVGRQSADVEIRSGQLLGGCRRTAGTTVGSSTTAATATATATAAAADCAAAAASCGTIVSALLPATATGAAVRSRHTASISVGGRLIGDSLRRNMRGSDP